MVWPVLCGVLVVAAMGASAACSGAGAEPAETAAALRRRGRNCWKLFLAMCGAGAPG